MVLLSDRYRRQISTHDKTLYSYISIGIEDTSDVLFKTAIFVPGNQICVKHHSFCENTRYDKCNTIAEGTTMVEQPALKCHSFKLFHSSGESQSDYLDSETQQGSVYQNRISVCWYGEPVLFAKSG